MASCSKITKTRRKLNKVASGKARKNRVRREGTTPNLFALNKPTVAEAAAKQNG